MTHVDIGRRRPRLRACHTVAILLASASVLFYLITCSRKRRSECVIFQVSTIFEFRHRSSDARANILKARHEQPNTVKYVMAKPDQLSFLPNLLPTIPPEHNVGIELELFNAKPIASKAGNGSRFPFPECTRADRYRDCCTNWPRPLDFPEKPSGDCPKSVNMTLPAEEKLVKSHQPCERFLLIVIFNWPHYSNIPKLRELYEREFTKMVVYGPKDDDLHEVVGVDIQNGFLFHRALVHAMLTYRDYDGYFWIGDDVYINYPMVFSTLSMDTVWTVPIIGTATVDLSMNTHPKWSHWKADFGVHAVLESYHCMRVEWLARAEARLGCKMCVTHGLVDIGYVPKVHVTELLECLLVLWRGIMEISLSMCLRLIGKRPVYDFLPRAINQQAKALRNHRWFFEHVNTSTSAVHPVKLSDPIMSRQVDLWLEQSRELYKNASKPNVCKAC